MVERKASSAAEARAEGPRSRRPRALPRPPVAWRGSLGAEALGSRWLGETIQGEASRRLEGPRPKPEVKAFKGLKPVWEEKGPRLASFGLPGKLTSFAKAKREHKKIEARQEKRDLEELGSSKLSAFPPHLSFLPSFQEKFRVLEEELKARHETELKELGPSGNAEPEAADRTPRQRPIEAHLPLPLAPAVGFEANSLPVSSDQDGLETETEAGALMMLRLTF